LNAHTVAVVEIALENGQAMSASPRRIYNAQARPARKLDMIGKFLDVSEILLKMNFQLQKLRDKRNNPKEPEWWAGPPWGNQLLVF